MNGNPFLLAETLVKSGSPAMTAALLGFALLLTFYGWLAVRSSAHATLTTQSFGLADALCAGILAIWMISVIFQSLDTPKSISLSVIIANCAVYACLITGIFGVMIFQRLSPVSVFQLQPSRFPRAAGMGLLWLAITYPLIIAAQALVQNIFGTGDDSQLIVRFFLEHADSSHRIAVIFMAVIVAPVAEEVIFRGYFYGVIRRYGGRIPALLTSSLLFAAIHVHLPSMLGLGILAVILCLLYERSGSLWAPITLHAAFNASTIVSLIIWPEMAG
jgi:membrane protease YdiL (CAAX protease family)